MKKFILLLSLFALTSCAIAQSSLPRWGSGPPQNDNTGRVLTYTFSPITTTTSTASLYQKPNAFESIFKMTVSHALTDSMSIKTAFVGDHVLFMFTGDTLTAGRVVTFGNNIKSTGTLTVPKSKKATTVFVFDGVAWVEESRSIMTN